MLRLGIEALIEYTKKRGQVIVRGWKTGEQGYLLTEKPRGPVSPLTPGQEAVIRMEHKGVLYGIAVTYREFLKKTDLCFFTFQDDVIARSLREDERIPCLLPVTVNRPDTQSSFQDSGLIVDLGKRGLRFVTRVPMYVELGDPLLASFHLGGIGCMDRQKIRLIRMSGNGGQFEYAAQFIDMDKERENLLDDYFAFCKAWAV
ncbi:MAG: PilZ domain-containing protein [Nitrospinae bacterium]|nr:PilZ domain-containing protein [Nitrospinota bacterium]